MLFNGKTQANIDKEQAEANRLQLIEDNKKYLLDTDWYIVRLSETGKDVPEDILTKRQQARDRISILQSEV